MVGGGGNGDDHHRKMFWRSASWSASRTAAPGNTTTTNNNSSGEVGNDFSDPNPGDGHNRRFHLPPLTPRSQHQSSKARSCLPPLSIAPRSMDEWPKASSDDIGEWLQLPTTPSGGGRGNNSNNNNNNGERLKLDLSSIQQNHDNGYNSNCNNSVGLVKRDKIASFDKECSKVADHVYLGGDAVAKDRDILKQNGITHVLNCVGFVCPEYFKADFVYRTLWLQDSPSEDITSILYDVFDYFEDVRELGGRVFVHCCQGVSRSTSLVIAYRMWREGQSFDDAFQYVKAARGIADPNMGFACQLLQCQKRVHAVPLSPSSLLRMYRIAPHSPYDPLHLVPKMLMDPSSSALDSRGAFIVHIPSAMYVWIGKNCEAIMERDARGAVGQIVRYEKVQGPVIMIKEGDEPSYFWDAFSKFLPLMVKSGNGVGNIKSSVKVWPGERKVGSYDPDFEVFGRAIKGGIMPPFTSSDDEHETVLPARDSSWSVLTRKVSSATTKEFVSAPKLPFPRVYSDSMLYIHTSANSFQPLPLSSSSLSLSSSSSPFCVSLDSISSNSNTHSKFLSELTPDSSSKVSAYVPVSSPLSNFSNLSLSSSSSHPVSTSADIHGVKLSHPHSQSASLPLKKPPTSLAERRGSLSKSLKLPPMNDNTQLTNKPPTFHASPKVGVLMNDNVSYLHQSDSPDHFYEDGHLNHKGVSSPQQCELTSSPGNVDGVDYKESSKEDLKCTSSDGTDDSGLLQRSMTESSVYHWPSLEKIDTFGASHLDSKAAFVIFSPSMPMRAGNILYFWLGRSFNCGGTSQVQLDSDRESDFPRAVDWNGIGGDILAQFSLPKNTIIKVLPYLFLFS
ncbi:hypothetical protein TanjilG_12074 [Lupinus angustifolius]|uniref:Protein-tyrosine-phosphatase MKP1 n=1 Tax=Lupinus angustifolius TaxID=3871 RepID=A0A1J7HY51_LUPAN|nr:hypothetical protein TanjilG_12074 [Lupinus angustifolius]